MQTATFIEKHLTNWMSKNASLVFFELCLDLLLKNILNMFTFNSRFHEKMQKNNAHASHFFIEARMHGGKLSAAFTLHLQSTFYR